MKIVVLALCFIWLVGCTNAKPINITSSLSEETLFYEVVSGNKPIMMSGNIEQKGLSEGAVLTSARYNDIGDSREAIDEITAFKNLCGSKGKSLVSERDIKHFQAISCRGEGADFVVITLMVKYIAGSDIGGYSYDRYLSLFEAQNVSSSVIKEAIYREYESYKAHVLAKQQRPLDFYPMNFEQLRNYLAFLDQ